MSIKVDGKTMNAISKLYSMHTPFTEFEFRVGVFKDGRFTPGVSREKWENMLRVLKQKASYVKEETRVTIYEKGFREIRGRTGVTFQSKKSVQQPVEISVGRFSLAEEKTVDAIPQGLKVVEVRDRFRYSFKFTQFTVELTYIKNKNKYEVEVEYPPNIQDIKQLFVPIRDLVSEQEDTSSIKKEFLSLFKRRDVQFNNALNMKRKFFGDLSDYVITPKWDGTRMMLYYSSNGPYLLNKTTIIKAPFQDKNVLHNTIFDGEFFEDTKKYIAFDLLFLNGTDLREKTRVERTLLLEQVHTEHALEFSLVELGSGPDMYTCFSDYTKKYPEHILDGVIFAPRSSTYYNTHTLKYKPIHLLTIDFLVVVDTSSRYTKYMLYVQGKNGPEPFTHVPYVQKIDDNGKDIIAEGNKIVEFTWRGDTFYPLRVRHDKTVPNFVTIAEDIWEDINNPITEDEMGNVLLEISRKFKTLSPFEGRWFYEAGPNYILSSADSSLSLGRSVAYCIDPRYQLKKESERQGTTSAKTIFDNTYIKKNIQVVDYYSGKVIYDNVAFKETIILAYTVGGHFYSVGRMDKINDVCSKVVRVFEEKTTHSDVKSHYDNLKYVEQDESISRNIRKYNNYVKALLISTKVQANNSVLDLGAGKGGDISKFCSQKISKLTAVDISPTSIKEAQRRFEKNPLCRNIKSTFIEANAYSDALNLEEHDVVSSQFSFHYAFGSRRDADVAVANVARNLKPGGVFIATIPNSQEILTRLKKYGNKYGNDHYSIEVKSHGLQFGSEYLFTLPDSVECCPEFLVDMSVLKDLFGQHNMVLEFSLPFYEFVDKYSMSFPYLHNKMGVAPLTSEEQEVTSLYNVVVFKKRI